MANQELNIEFSGELSALAKKLDSYWETELLTKLPFPVAYVLNQLRQENYAWDLLLKDIHQTE